MARKFPRFGPLLFCTLIYVFLLAPVLVVLIASLDDTAVYFAKFPPESISLRWYFEIPARYVNSLLVSITAATLSAAIAGILGTIAAFGIVRGRVPGAELMRVFFRAPLQIPFVVTGVVYLQFYYGLYSITGIEFAGSLAGLVFAYVLIGTPYTIGTVGAVLERLNPRLEEAGSILGASDWSVFWKITFPMVRPAILAGTLFAFVIAFGDVPIAIFLSSAEYTTLPVEIFQTLQFDFKPSVLAVSSLISIFSVILLYAIQRMVQLDTVISK